ncbi:porin [Reinekea marinisedimentorum]|uniref:Putative porin n=1 Tax=Reinekea marinisedimentorum TaxID=230495 RepID=A0A4R3I137_9GAMM|nr:porin [Reinekea marinisedimentorum]TCS38904.1 putative porin [Reinekea marinisedimentorum]
MKKLALSIAVSSIALAAASAQADETIYENDGLSLTVGADVEYAFTVQGDDSASLDIDDADFDVKISSEMENGATVFGFFEIEENGQDAVQLSDSYVGFSYDAVTVSVGKQITAADNFGIGQDFWFGVGNDAKIADYGSEVVYVEYAADAFTVVAAADLALEGEETDDEAVYDLYVEADVADGVTVSGMLQSTTDFAADDTTTFGIAASYSMDEYTVGAEYSYETETEVGAWEVAGAYSINATTFVAGFGDSDTDEESSDFQYYLGAGYDLTDNASVYAEIAGDDADDSDMGFALGMALSF